MSQKIIIIGILSRFNRFNCIYSLLILKAILQNIALNKLMKIHAFITLLSNIQTGMFRSVALNKPF